MSIVIRKAELADIAGIRQVAKWSWNATYKELIPEKIQQLFLERAYQDEVLRKRIRNHLFLVAEDHGRVIGFASGQKRGNQGELSSIYLLPEYQRKGIGSELLNRFISLLSPVDSIIVEVEKGNRIGENFYEARGFRLVAEYDEDFFGHTLHTKKMILPLQSASGFSPEEKQK